LENGTAKNDWAKARELLRIAAGILKPGAPEEELKVEVIRLKDEWFEEAGRIIEPNAALIEQFVSHFMEKLEAHARRSGLQKLAKFKLTQKDVFQDQAGWDRHRHCRRRHPGRSNEAAFDVPLLVVPPRCDPLLLGPSDLPVLRELARQRRS
jgi:hypothetical protein